MKSRKPQNKTKRESRRSRKKLIIVSILLAIVFSTFTWVMNNERFKISRTEISGNKTILDIDIQKTIQENLDKKILWLLPRDNVLLTNTKHIEKNIQNTYPKIYATNVSIVGGSDLVIEIEEREPHSLWCRNENYENSFDEECYFADQRGYIYAPAPYFSGGVFEKIYTSNELLQIGEQVLDKDDFIEFFDFTNSLLDNYGIIVDRVFVGERNETRIYFSSFLEKNFKYKPYLIYHNTDSYELIGRNIRLMIKHDLFKKEFKNTPNRLEFIDVRIIDQIRYKFTTGEEIFERKEKEEKEIELIKNNTEIVE